MLLTTTSTTMIREPSSHTTFDCREKGLLQYWLVLFSPFTMVIISWCE